MKKIIVIFISLFIISCENNSVDKIEFKQQDSCFCKTSILGIFNLKLGMSKDSVLKLINNPKKEFDKQDIIKYSYYDQNYYYGYVFFFKEKLVYIHIPNIDNKYKQEFHKKYGTPCDSIIEYGLFKYNICEKFLWKESNKTLFTKYERNLLSAYIYYNQYKNIVSIVDSINYSETSKKLEDLSKEL